VADDNEKTEQPTARRRTEARDRGQIAKSQDLVAATLLLIGLLTLQGFGDSILGRLFRITDFMLGGTGGVSVRGSQLVPLGLQAAREMFSILVPIMLLFLLAALIMALLQTGLLLTTEPIKPDLSKVNPIAGFKRIFSPHTVVTMVINLAKLGVVSVVVYYSVIAELDRIVFASGLALTEMVSTGIDIFFSLGIRVALALMVLGILDWFYQRYKHEKELRMSKEEVKEEMRSMEGDPVMRRRRREVQMQLALQRLKKDVPEADVVVTNPTHIAVALKYDMDTMPAPRLIAKGEGYVAQRIREIALEAGVPVVEKKPLARTLFKLVEVGQEIPAQLFKAVAEVLAYVYELSGKQQQIRAGAA
jgi:flagellar biosynthetic protein FlhB